VERMTISVFGRAVRLSPKALRQYDELGLLPPAHVDPASGYRFYEASQLERARLVAWLRHLGMPLARIKRVLELDPAAAAEEVGAYWARVEAETASRRDLVTFLIGHLSGRTAADTDGAPPRAAIRYACGTDAGLVRPSNQDAVYAGSRLLAVADGFGPDDTGTAASAAVIGALRPFDTELAAGDLLNTLHEALDQAQRALQQVVTPGTAPSRAGTTLTALLWSGSRLALVHIGDSRAYLLRAGAVCQITHDHTMVQALVDEGRLSPDEASSHPQRALLRKALTAEHRADADLHLRDAKFGDRYLLCSDGLSAVVGSRRIHETLMRTGSPDDAVRRLIRAAKQAGGPDNVSCVVADVVAAGDPTGNAEP
jgi:serine/threonine protein phosphatase PrpC